MPNIQAQSKYGNLFTSNFRSKLITVNADTVLLDTLSILRPSVIISGYSDTCYTLLAEDAKLVWRSTCSRPDSVQISYRVLAFSLTRPYSLPQYRYDSNFIFPVYRSAFVDTNGRGFVNFKSLEYSGSYSRSVSAGNNQSVGLNSNFNMQINGYILDSVRIEAAITDNNIPFQPEGNTQQLQEFDRLYIIFEKDKHKLTVGDYSLENPTSYFLNFNKRVQGIYYQGNELKIGGTKHTVGGSASIAKGQFARNIFQGLEGNQGPYKLQGNNGEQFFILLAGTERVFIDGVLLQRGEDRDYIINYNTGEIVFMPRILITKDKRIQVEFEYQDRNYLNSLIYAYDDVQISKKLKVHVNLYSNQDAKNQPYLQTLGDEQKRFLRSVGDDINQAFYTNAQPDTFAANKILYRLIDTTVAGFTYDSVYVYSKDSSAARYNLGFSYVGEMRGDYAISGENTNGRSYAWTAPIDGKPQGSYAPVVLLITPKKLQIITTAATYQIDSLKVLTVELSGSNYEPNLFGVGNQSEHLGYSGRATYAETRLLGKADTLGKKPLIWSNTASYEYVQSRYRAVAPYRNVEFGRDWNVSLADSNVDETLVNASSKLEKIRLGNVQYDFTYYQRGSNYHGYRNIAQVNYLQERTKAGVVLNLMQNESSLYRTSFLRPSAYAEHNFLKTGELTFGTRYELEHNQVYFRNADSLVPQAFSFDVLQGYMRLSQPSAYTLGIKYTMRRDRLIRNKEFEPKNTGHTVDVNFAITKWKNQSIDFTGSYRNLVAQDTFNIANAPGSSLVGRLSYTGNILDRFLTPSLVYEFGSGQEQKRSFTFVEVPAGQGAYYWVDYNGDGVQQANEFEIGVYQDQKKFIKIITPTNEYVKVNFGTLNASLGITPERLWAKNPTAFFPKVLSRLSNQLSMQVTNKGLASAGFGAYLPLFNGLADSAIINTASTINNTVYYNRNSAKWGLEYTINYNASKALLTYGLERISAQQNQLQARYNINKSLSTNVKGRNGSRSFFSGITDGRTFDLKQLGGSAALTYILQSKLRLTASYDYDQSLNQRQYGGEVAFINSVALDGRLSLATLGSLSATTRFTQINYTGDENSSVGFVMLSALKKGTNLIWNLNYDTRLGKGIELSIEYEGRKPGDTKVIHTGRMSLRAIL